MRATLAAALLALMFHAITSAQAQTREAAPVAEDPVIEARVMSLANELRCLVCQNQTIADSNAALAVDLRNQVRDQVKAGRSDEQIIDYLVARYGDFVLYRPPVKMTTVLLWVGPFVLLVAGLAGLTMTLRRRARAQGAPGVLGAAAGSDDDPAETRARAKALLDAGAPARGEDRA